jgi:outer membrane protein assembly factor BamA
LTSIYHKSSFINFKSFLPAIACLLQYIAQAQDSTSAANASFTIERIYINGNKKTKPYIILRELSFKEGDTVKLSELVKKFDYARNQLYNTRLFNDVIVAVKSFTGYKVSIQVDVKERWYIFPLPYLKPVDRNLAAWADKNYSLSRLNYGLKFSWYNFTGRNDKLKLWLITGYSRQLQFSYEQPYADKKLQRGYIAGFSYARFKEINASTLNNEQYFINTDSAPFAGRYLNEQWNGYIGYTYRPAIRTRHVIQLGFSYNKIDSAIATANPKYFNNNKKAIYYPELSYTVTYNKIDYVAYPLKGFLGEAGVIKKGINSDMNSWELYTKDIWARKLAHKTWYNLYAYGSLKLPFDQPFYNSRQLGYSDLYLRGLERYVVDGVAAALVRNTFKREIASFMVPTYLRSRSHDVVPFKIYLKAYGDIGYVYNKNFPGNSLVNRMLYTAGTGLDVVTLYDFVFRVEYSFNQLGQNGLFLHIKNEF